MLFVVLLVLALLGIAPWIQALYASWVGVGMIALVHAEVEPETPQRFTANLKRFLRSQVWPALHAQGSLEMVDERSPSLDGRGQRAEGRGQRAEYDACYKFCRRQRPDLLDTLLAGADHLGAIAFELERWQLDALLDWKLPDAYALVELTVTPFADLATTASACSYIKAPQRNADRSAL